MLTIYLKIITRNLIKNKSYSLVNIFGLSIGIACALLILLWVRHELSYDRFHLKGNEIYRVVQHDSHGINSRSPAMLGPAVISDVPGVTAYTRVFKVPRSIFRQGEYRYYEDNGIVADPEFLSIFDFQITGGNVQTSLAEPFNIVITESLAEKYFGSTDPLFQTIELDGISEFKVAGVLKDIPATSHLQFDFILPFSLLEMVTPHDIANWGGFNYTTYILLDNNTDVSETTDRINTIASARIPPAVLPFWYKFDLQPLHRCYLSAEIDNDHFLGSFTVSENRTTVNMFSTIALFILLLACINFMNISTARSGTRAREIGMKKVIGSSRIQLIAQFLGEFLLISIIAFIMALVLVELFLPYFNQLSGKTLNIDHTKNLIPYVLIILLTTLLGGMYPAFYLSSLMPVKMLKGRIGVSGKVNKTRSLLVVFQFIISIVLIAGTIIVYQQLQYIQNKDLGFRKDNIVYIHIDQTTARQYGAIKTELLQNPDILSVSAKDCLPTDFLRVLVDFYWDEKREGQEILMELTGIDFDYIEMLGINLAEGRSFSEHFSTDAVHAFILNEEAVRQTGLASPIGQRFATWNKSGEIIGVIKNTNFKSLHREVNPQVYHIMSNLETEIGMKGVLLIKISERNRHETISFIKNVWNRLNPDAPFEYHSLDHAYERLYTAEQRTKSVIEYFSYIAVLIACLGLYGLAAFTAESRRKEIGIRKTLGADIRDVVSLFTAGITRLILIANIIAWPIAWYLMTKWLDGFAYRTDLHWWVFLLAGSAALSIALLTVGIQAIKAATANPVKSLRYE
jgi:putative ABC transport system permease protein